MITTYNINNMNGCILKLNASIDNFIVIQFYFEKKLLTVSTNISINMLLTLLSV